MLTITHLIHTIKYSIFTLFLLSQLVMANQAVFTAISDDKIDISANFKGKNILLFGAKDQAGQIFVVIRGPEKHLQPEKKESSLVFGLNESLLNSPTYQIFIK